MADFADAKRILVRSTNWLGDVVMSLPALRAIRRGFPEAHLGVMIRSNLAPLLQGTDECDEVVDFQRPRRGLLAGRPERSALYERLRRGEWDLGVLFPNSFSSAWYFRQAGIPRRAGYGVNWRRWALTDAVPREHGRLARHQVHYYLEIASFLGTAGDPDDCLYDPPAQATESAGRLLEELGVEPGSFVAMAPAAAYGPAKEWPAAHYVRLAMLLAHQRGLRTVVIGAPAEGAKCGEVASLAAERAPGAVSAAGRTDLAELAALMKLSCGFVGNDSGAMHLAGVTGIPTVGIFGSTRPDVTGPLGPRAVALAPADDVREKLLLSCVPCLRRTCRYGHYRCLKSLSPEEALDALAWMLDNPEGRGSPPSAPRGKIVNPGGAK